MKLLNGSELAGFIKERQARDVRRLKAQKIIPKLAIVQVKDDPEHLDSLVALALVQDHALKDTESGHVTMELIDVLRLRRVQAGKGIRVDGLQLYDPGRAFGIQHHFVASAAEPKPWHPKLLAVPDGQPCILQIAPPPAMDAMPVVEDTELLGGLGELRDAEVTFDQFLI